MAQGGLHALLQRGRRPRPALEGGADLREHPGVALRGAADHHVRAAGFFQHAPGVRARAHVAIAQNGNVHGAHDFGDDPPVGLSGVELIARAGVDGHGARALAFANAGHFGGVDAGCVPAGAYLRRHRQLRRPHGGAHHLSQQFRLAHQGAALAVADDLRRGAAKVEVDKGKALAFQLFGGAGDVLRLAAKELQPGRALTGEARQKLRGVAVFAPGEHPALGREHLAHRPVRALLKAEHARGRVGDARHRRQPHERRGGLPRQRHAHPPCKVAAAERAYCRRVFFAPVYPSRLVMNECGGTDLVSQVLPPMTLPLPTVTSPPRMVAPA